MKTSGLGGVRKRLEESKEPCGKGNGLGGILERLENILAGRPKKKKKRERKGREASKKKGSQVD